MIGENRVSLHMPGVRSMDAGGVGIHRHHLDLRLFGCIAQVDRVPVGSVHGAVIQTGQARRMREQGFGLREGITVSLVEAPGDLA